MSRKRRSASRWSVHRGWRWSCPVLSFPTPGGCWKLLTGSHWGLLLQSKSGKEKKREKKGMKQHWCWLCPHFMLVAGISLVNYNISLSVNVFLYLGSDRVNWGSAATSKMGEIPATIEPGKVQPCARGDFASAKNLRGIGVSRPTSAVSVEKQRWAEQGPAQPLTQGCFVFDCKKKRNTGDKIH